MAAPPQPRCRVRPGHLKPSTQGAHAIDQAGQTRARSKRGATSTIIGDNHPDVAVLLQHAKRDVLGIRILDGVRHGLTGDVVGRRTHLVGEVDGIERNVDRNRRLSGEVGQRGGEAVIEAARPEPVRDLAELGDGRGDLGNRLVEYVVEVGAGRQVPLGYPQPHAERDQALLSSVVQILLEPPPFVVAGLDQSAPTRLHLSERVAEHASQPGRLGQQRRGVRDVGAGRRGVGP
jgi:hypothetical protein